MQKEIAKIISENGFYLYKNFMTDSDIKSIYESYHNLEISDNKNYPVRTIGLEQLPSQLIENLNAIKDLCCPDVETELTNAVFFSINTSDLDTSINSGLHQDHESYYISGDHLNHLNFFMIIEKEDKSHSNLNLVPKQRLLQKDKKFYQLANGSGASMIDGSNYHLQEKNLTYNFEFDVNSIVETPNLSVGDMLIIRGDLIHGTQDQMGNRIALSVRSGRQDFIVDKNRYYPISLNHLHFIKNNVKPYSKRAFLFAYSGLDFMTISELNALYTQVGNNYNLDISRKFNNFHEKYLEYIKIYEESEQLRQDKFSQMKKIASS